MDPLSQIVDLLRPRALLWKEMVGRGDWAWRFSAQTGVVFGLVLEGECRFEIPDLAAGALRAGDYLLITAPPTWYLRNGAPVPPIDFEAIDQARMRMSPESDVSDSKTTRIVGGHFAFDTANADLLTSLLSPIIRIRSGKAKDRLSTLLTMIDEEARSDRPGREQTLTRLLEIVLIDLLRSCTSTYEGSQGLLAGLADPLNCRCVARLPCRHHAHLDRGQAGRARLHVAFDLLSTLLRAYGHFADGLCSRLAHGLRARCTPV